MQEFNIWNALNISFVYGTYFWLSNNGIVVIFAIWTNIPDKICSLVET